MKCIRCGYENEDNAKFCTSCGAPLKQPVSAPEDVLVELAAAYTGSTSAAKEIASGRTTIREVSEACVKWIRTRETTLFLDAQKSEEAKPLLDTMDNTENTLRSLDYEERIVVLMHCLEKMDPPAIARILHISEDNVIYYLQSAYEKNHPSTTQKPLNAPAEKKKTVRRKRPAKKVEKKTSPERSGLIQKISWQAKLTVAVIIALIAGTFFGIKNYAAQEYQTGTALLEEGKYQEAVDPLMNAKRYGGSKDAGLKLGDAYYGQEEYEKALSEYQTCHSSTEEVNQALIRTYDKLAEASIAADNYGEAAGYLQNQYDLDQDERTHIRLEAVQNNGSYTDEEGSVYTVWGDPEKLVAMKNGKKLFQVNLEYNEDRTLKVMKESISDSSSKITYNQLSSASNLEASWILQKDGTIAYSVQTSVQDEQGNPTLITVTTPSSVKKTSYTYTYNDGKITSAVIKTSTGTTQAKYQYEDGHLKEIQYSDNTSTTYEYDRKGQLIHLTTIDEDENILSDTSYEYDDSGRLSEEITKRKEADGILPFSTDRDIAYTYSEDGTPRTMTIRNENTVIAKGYSAANSGWIVLYNTVEDK